MNKRVLGLGLVLAFCCCTISYADKYQYWDELNDVSKSEIIKTLNVDPNIMMLYLHQINLSDDNMSEAILDTLCTPTDGYKRLFYFHIMNKIVRCADGAFAEILGAYCTKYIMINADYALVYFRKHQDVSNDYSVLIATELYYNNICITDYKQQLSGLVKDEDAKVYLPFFLCSIEHEFNSINGCKFTNYVRELE